jgi:hypothetical protein
MPFWNAERVKNEHHMKLIVQCLYYTQLKKTIPFWFFRYAYISNACVTEGNILEDVRPNARLSKVLASHIFKRIWVLDRVALGRNHFSVSVFLETHQQPFVSLKTPLLTFHFAQVLPCINICLLLLLEKYNFPACCEVISSSFWMEFTCLLLGSVIMWLGHWGMPGVS